jgi:hypothetical protein
MRSTSWAMSDFYRELQAGAMRLHQPGQIFWVPAPMISKDALGLRLGFLKEGQDITQVPLTISRLRCEDIGRPAEAEKVEFHKRMPMPEISLSASEDLLIHKVKKRPAVLLFKSGLHPRRFANYVSGGTSKPVNPNHYVFAPIYSLHKQNNVGHDYPPAFINDLQAGKFPHLLHLPAYKNNLPNESMVVLNDLFGVGIQAFEETPLAIEPLELASKLDEFFEYFQGELLDQTEG